MKYQSLFIFSTLLFSQFSIQSAYSEEYKDAAITFNTKKILELDNQGCSINSINPFTGETHLASAAAKGQVDIIKALLFYRADRNAKNINGRIALDWAKAKSDEKAIELLSGN